ncbi:MAG: Lrp/AsnC family transcriptional regulator [Firmicutes bacterium]|nr:Lrp/AsnC family transcriptional regulator [Bacillota bacterium]
MFDTLDMHILEILFEDARITPEQVSVMTGADVLEVRRRVKRLEDERVLIKYPAMINWERTEKEMVQAVIEVRVQPQRDRGFDAVAARIYEFEEVTSCYLMSGAYDLMVMLEAPTLKQLAAFVHAKLSTIESVTGTATHFILKTYKYGGAVFEGKGTDRRLAVTP